MKLSRYVLYRLQLDLLSTVLVGQYSLRPTAMFVPKDSVTVILCSFSLWDAHGQAVLVLTNNWVATLSSPLFCAAVLHNSEEHVQQ